MITSEQIIRMAREFGDQEKTERQQRQAQGRRWSFAGATTSEFEDALNAIPNNDLPYDQWLRIGMAIKNALNGNGEAIFDAFSRRSRKYNEADQRRYWPTIDAVANNGSSVTGATIFYEALKHGWQPKPENKDSKRSKEATPSIPGFSEESLALQLVAERRDKIRYVGDVGEWRIWTGPRWESDSKRKIFDTSRDICRRAAGEAAKNTKLTNLARSLASAKTRYAIVSLASDDQRIAMLNADFDKSPKLLGTLGGTINLDELGGIQTARPEDYITKLTSVSPALPGTPYPTWQAFLESTFPLADHGGPDHDLINFLQRWSGYCLSGNTHEHKFVFCYGTGRNGKNIFVDVLADVLNDYAVRIPSEVLMRRHVEPHRSELMPMQGARLIIANEIEKGAQWNQGRLMAITSGDRISANAMRSNPVTFPIVGKLMVIGNNKPSFRTITPRLATVYCWSISECTLWMKGILIHLAYKKSVLLNGIPILPQNFGGSFRPSWAGCWTGIASGKLRGSIHRLPFLPIAPTLLPAMILFSNGRANAVVMLSTAAIPLRLCIAAIVIGPNPTA